MALEQLLETNNFEQWLNKINEIIRSLGASDVLAGQLLEALSEAIQRNQTAEYLGNPETTITVPDGSTIPGGTVWSWDWNDYTSNGVYWIPWTASTCNPPLGRAKSGMCWVASGGPDGPTIQLAAIFDSRPANDALEDTPTLAVRYGATGEAGSGPAWPKYANGSNIWIEIPNKKYLDTNFLNKTANALQTVAGPVRLKKTLQVDGNATFAQNASVRGQFIFRGASTSVVVNPDDEANSDQNGEGNLTMEVAPSDTLVPDTSPNLPIWNTATGSYVSSARRTKYSEPFWIDKEERTANINGTAEYANFIVPTNMVSEFNSANISPDQLWLPATAKSVKDLFDWTKSEFLPLKGGVLTGIVRHEQDIFLEHLQGVQENRTAAIRSVVRPLQLQCQGSTHIVSNSKHASLYLEKEDADSAEYTTEHHDASFVFRKVVLNKELCLTADPNFMQLNSDPELDGCWYCRCANGNFKIFENGSWEFAADEKLLGSLGPNEKLKTTIFYSVMNAVSGTSIASRCQYDIEFKSGDPAQKSGNLSINDIHYQIAVTDTDWTSLPITCKSTLGQGTRLVDGSLVKSGSKLNGMDINEDWVVNGLQLAFGTKEEHDFEEPTKTPAMLATGSVIAKGSKLKMDSIVNRRRWTNDSIVNSDIEIVEDSTLAKGSILKSGSIIGLNSVINGFQYTEPETVNGEEIGEDSHLQSGSSIIIGSLIATTSAINGVPGKTGYMEVVQGRDPSELNGSLANGSTILEGSVLAPGSEVNEVRYDVPTIVERKITVCNYATIAHGSKLAAGSWIEVGSILNGLRWTVGTRACGLDAVLPLAAEDLAPILYIRTYDNLQGKWESFWHKSSYRSVYPNATSFDADIWRNWFSSQINSLEISDEMKSDIMADLDLSLSNAPREWNYPLRSDVNGLVINGKWMLDRDYLRTDPYIPDHVFETRCYVASHFKNIGIERLTVQPFEVLYDESGARSGLLAIADAAMIFNEGTSIKAYFKGQAFEYFNFNVVPGIGSEYVVTYDTRLIPEQKNLQKKSLMEVLVFKAYANDINSSGEEIASFEKSVSLNVEDMMGAPFVFGTRTRTGITSTGQLGDPLYDLGCMEITEDSLALKLRKRSVTMQSEIKDTVSLTFERSTDLNSSENFPVDTMQRDEGFTFRPSVDEEVDLGTGDLRFRNLYLSGDPIVSSDKSLKTEVADFPESLMKRWHNVKWTSFKFKDAVKAKGKKARIHAGVVAQDVKKALSGMDVSKWSFFCRDSWGDRKEYEWIDIPAGTDEFGVWRDAHTEKRIVTSVKAGEQYSIRYQEMQCIENAYLRHEIELLKKEIELLKQKIK